MCGEFTGDRVERQRVSGYLAAGIDLHVSATAGILVLDIGVSTR